jgi:hypothetical protein
MVRRADAPDASDAERRAVEQVFCVGCCDLLWVLIALLGVLLALTVDEGATDTVYAELSYAEAGHALIGAAAVLVFFMRYLFAPAHYIFAGVILVAIDAFVLAWRVIEVRDNPDGCANASCIILFLCNVVFVATAFFYFAFGLDAGRHWGMWGDSEDPNDLFVRARATGGAKSTFAAAQLAPRALVDVFASKSAARADPGHITIVNPSETTSALYAQAPPVRGEMQ